MQFSCPHLPMPDKFKPTSRLSLQLPVIFFALVAILWISLAPAAASDSDCPHQVTGATRLSRMDHRPVSTDSNTNFNQSASESDRQANQNSNEYLIFHSEIFDLPSHYQMPIWAAVGIFIVVACTSIASRYSLRRREQPTLTDLETANPHAPTEGAGPLVSSSKHELNNLLTAIVSAAELGKLVDDPEQKNELFDTILVTGIATARTLSSSRLAFESFEEHASVELADKRVLFVDDDEFVRRMGERIFSDCDVDLVVMDSAEAAIQELENGVPFDCVITDFELPDMNGSEVAKCVKELAADLPVVLISGNQKADVFDPEIYDVFVAKPFQESDLLAAVSQSFEISKTHA